MLPEVGPMSRARWAHLLRDDPDRLHTAYSLEQVLEEGAFVIGPVLAVLAATTLFPEAGLLLAEGLFMIGALLFLSARATEPPVVPHEERPAGLAIQRPGMLVVASVLFLVGVLFGANEVVAVAVSDEAGRKAFSSTILAAFALGSAISGLVFGSRTLGPGIIRRFVLLGAAMSVLQAPVLLTHNLWGLTAIMFVAGSATAPMLITALTITHRLVPPALLTEGMAVAVTGILIGISAGTAVAGFAVEAVGGHTAYLLPVGAAALAATLAYAGRARIREGLLTDE
jgi:predicted MFS family arabinose efflux permease